MEKKHDERIFYDFLGFSIGAIAELEEDCDDIIRGVYPELMEKMGLKSDKREERETPSIHPSESLLTPSAHWTLSEVEKLRFYPLDPNLPLVIQLKLRCKELNFLLKKLQDSLEEKMKSEKTLTLKDKSQIIEKKKLESMDVERKIMQENGLIRLENGKFIPKEAYFKMKEK